ncbi:small integral membrane protein 22 [Artibeus jamaicensis]|uniref:small integral membrane protein 22 n=1 Tax=Artibeus jamaicensis TaxID=9417 RepID=UPI00235AB450|nr:small integral membrane protein 22 [Artibeus jamaicensis]XP_053527736.1 small integral membrane protein 22 [Artibeus jamaicensis]XP_053527737.1 small integral membrane protein 22 [Artibeus jamaicensis]
MDNLEELESTVAEVLGKLRSHQPFQSTWDTAAFIVLLLFLGTVLLLLLLACLHCCCCYRSSRSKKVDAMGVNNLALEP